MKSTELDSLSPNEDSLSNLSSRGLRTLTISLSAISAFGCGDLNLCESNDGATLLAFQECDALDGYYLLSEAQQMARLQGAAECVRESLHEQGVVTPFRHDDHTELYEAIEKSGCSETHNVHLRHLQRAW